MVRVRRSGFVFVQWIGDHSPVHVHVYRRGRLVVKWDLEHGRAMRGRASRRLQELLRELMTEGLLRARREP